MTRILVCPCDRSGVGRYRLGLPISALQRQESTLQLYLSEGLPVKFDLGTGKALGLTDGFQDWDVVVLQRPMADWQVQCLRDCRDRGIRTIVEVDDDFRALHYLNPAQFQTHPRLSKQWNRRWLDVACREADLVTVTTPALARRYAPHGRVAIIPNYISEAWLSIEAEKTDLLVGWTGTVATHQGDLAVTHGGVAQVIRESDARFRVIGNSELTRRDLALDDDPETVPWTDWENYPHEIVKLDVGIAPLADSGFNRAKSWLKPLEYAALGVPCVMSPVASYEEAHRLGIGVLAKDRARDWRREVGRLVRDKAYRTETAQRAREAVSALTIEQNAWRWAEAWTTSALRSVPISTQANAL